MLDYANYQIPQQKVYFSANPKAKKEETEPKPKKLEKAVTYTIGTLIGVGAAALIGYGIINKPQSKKVVDKAKEAASEVVKKGNKKGIEDQIKTVQTLLGKLEENEQFTLQEAEQLKNVLIFYKKNLILFEHIDTTSVSTNIDNLIKHLIRFINKNVDVTKINATDHNDLLHAKKELSTSLMTINNIIKNSYEKKQEEVTIIQDQIKNINVEVEEETIITSPTPTSPTSPPPIPFTNDKNNLKELTRDTIKVDNVAVILNSDNSDLYLLLDSNNLGGFETTLKETFRYTLGAEEKDCYLFKVEDSISIENLNKLIQNDNIKKALLEHENGRSYLKKYLEGKAQEIANENQIYDSTTLSSILNKIDEIDKIDKDELSKINLQVKTALAINKLKYDKQENLFANFKYIATELFENSQETKFYFNRNGESVDEDKDYAISVEFNNKQTTVIDKERGLTYEYILSETKKGKLTTTTTILTVNYNPFQNLVNLFKAVADSELQYEDLLENMKQSTFASFKKYIKDVKIEKKALWTNGSNVLDKLKAAQNFDDVKEKIRKNPNGIKTIIANTNQTKQYNKQEDFDKVFTSTSKMLIKSHLLQMFAIPPTRNFMPLKGFNGEDIGNFDIIQGQDGENVTTYTSNETPTKTYKVTYNKTETETETETEEKVTVEEGSNTYTYNINANAYDDPLLTPEKEKVDLFVFFALPDDASKVKFAKAQIQNIIETKTVTTKNRELTFFVTYIANHDEECQKNASGNIDENNSIKTIWSLILNGKAKRGKKISAQLDNIFYITKDGALTHNEPTSKGEKYIKVDVNDNKPPQFHLRRVK